MGDFQLGQITVRDNGDGIYNPPVTGAKTPQDEIVDASGTAVTPTGKDAQAALKSLGITSLTGLKLSPASRYLDSLARAKQFSSQGDTFQVEEFLRKARIAAAEAKLAFRESDADQLITTSLKNEVDLLADRAKILAKNGDVVALGDVFNAAREIFSRLGVDMGDAKSKGYKITSEAMEQWETDACSNAIPLLLTNAEKFSLKGNVAKTQELLLRIQDYGGRPKVGLSTDQKKKIQDLQKQAYRNSVDLQLAEAAKFAPSGDLEQTRYFLKEAKNAATLGGVSLSTSQSQQLQSIEKLALKNAADFYLRQADLNADQGKVEATRDAIQAARDAAAETGQKLSKTQESQADASLQKALLLSVDILLKDASKAVAQVNQDGNISQVRGLIRQARENASLANASLTTAQETSVQSILDQAYDAAIAWRFKQAQSAADLGKVDDTIVPLNAGRELAKQGGRTFDEAAAKGLTDKALTGGIELELKAAEGFAKAGDKDNTYLHLELARDNWRRLKKTPDEKRIAKIVKLLP